MATALKRYNGGRVLVFVMGAFAEMSGDVSHICDIIAHVLARTNVSYNNSDANYTKGMYRQRVQKTWGHKAHRGWTARRTAAPTARRCRRTRAIRTATSSITTPRGGATSPPRRAQPLLLTGPRP